SASMTIACGSKATPITPPSTPPSFPRIGNSPPQGPPKLCAFSSSATGSVPIVSAPPDTPSIARSPPISPAKGGGRTPGFDTTILGQAPPQAPIAQAGTQAQSPAATPAVTPPAKKAAPPSPAAALKPAAVRTAGASLQQ